MRKASFQFFIAIILFSSCGTTQLPKSTVYKDLYNEKPVSFLLMPPINRSTNVEAKEYFHSTLNVPIINAGYYVIPPFLSMEILKKESAYDAELFLTNSLMIFNEVFGADVALFTIIHKWDKNAIGAKVSIEVEYIAKSIRTNKILYTRHGSITYDASVKANIGGAWGALADLALSAVNTAATQYVDLARTCNGFTFSDLPAGKYSPNYGVDGNEIAGKQKFKKSLSSQTKY